MIIMVTKERRMSKTSGIAEGNSKCSKDKTILERHESKSEEESRI